MTDPQPQPHSSAGHAVYTPAVLAVYDAWVLGVSNRWLWKCPTARLLAHYQQHVTANHLDVGVGTGYFLARCRFPADNPRIALLDVNAHALRKAARRIDHHRPEVYEADIRAPLTIDVLPFDSIGLNFVLHCLPGSLREKSSVLGRLAAYLTPGGVLFGATLLGAGVSPSALARALMTRYQSRGIFSNATDDEPALRAALAEHFHDVTIETIGCAALFSARGLR
jgi:trans-aconitate methyltransferase